MSVVRGGTRVPAGNTNMPGTARSAAVNASATVHVEYTLRASLLQRRRTGKACWPRRVQQQRQSMHLAMGPEPQRPMHASTQQARQGSEQGCPHLA